MSPRLCALQFCMYTQLFSTNSVLCTSYDNIYSSSILISLKNIFKNIAYWIIPVLSPCPIKFLYRKACPIPNHYHSFFSVLFLVCSLFHRFGKDIAIFCCLSYSSSINLLFPCFLCTFFSFFQTLLNQLLLMDFSLRLVFCHTLNKGPYHPLMRFRSFCHFEFHPTEECLEEQAWTQPDEHT